MKFFSIVVGLLHLTHLGLSAPLNNEDSLHVLSQHGSIPEIQSLDLWSTNEAHNALMQLEARAPHCVNRAIQIFGLNDSAAVLSYVTLIGLGAQTICEHYHDTECSWWASFITAGINAIFAIARGGMRTSGAVGESPYNSVSSFARRALPAESYADTLAQAFSDFGVEYNDIEDVDISSLYHTKRDSTEPDLTHRLIVRGIKANNFTHDIAFNQYSNGGHILHLGSLNDSGPAF